MTPIILVRELKKILKDNLGESIHDVIIFGSRIRKNARPGSDYDVLIILKGKCDRQTRRIISDICYDLELMYNIIIDSQLITLDELNKGIVGKHPVVLDAIAEGIHA